jgi:hypothetical protein
LKHLKKRCADVWSAAALNYGLGSFLAGRLRTF